MEWVRLIWLTHEGEELSHVFPAERLEHLLDVCEQKGLEVIDFVYEA